MSCEFPRVLADQAVTPPMCTMLQSRLNPVKISVCPCPIFKFSRLEEWIGLQRAGSDAGPLTLSKRL